MSTRLNNSATGAFVIIQQRLHERDLIGDILKKHGVVEDGGECIYLCLPAECEPDHPNRLFRDPRTEAGELLWSPPQKAWIIVDVQRWRDNPAEIERIIRRVSDEDAIANAWVKISLPQDPGQAGKGQRQALLRLFGGYNVKAEPQSGDKTTRAMPLASQASSGNVKIVDAPWNDDFLDEVTSFPTGAHDDQVDAAASAFNRIMGGRNGLLEFYQRQLSDWQRAEVARMEARGTRCVTLPDGAALTGIAI